MHLELEGRCEAFPKREACCSFPWERALVLKLKERVSRGRPVERVQRSQETLPEQGPSFCSLEVTLRRRQDCPGVRQGWGGEETASLELPGQDFSRRLIRSFIRGP